MQQSFLENQFKLSRMSSTITKKRKILIFIVLGIIGILLIYTWFTFIFTNARATFNHYLGLLLFVPLIYICYVKKITLLVILTGLYLILGTINIISFLPFISSSSFGISIGSFPIQTPGLNGYSLTLLILYSILNFDTLTDLYLDYKQSKSQL
jgi:hypothetical protein